ncbi:MAG: glucoamylase family protein [Planctomycetota bacterium]
MSKFHGSTARIAAGALLACAAIAAGAVLVTDQNPASPTPANAVGSTPRVDTKPVVEPGLSESESTPEFVHAWAVAPETLAGLGLKADPIAEWRAHGPDDAKAPLGHEGFLDLWQRRCFLYFLEHAHPETGQVADRAKALGRASSGPGDPVVSSVAATGFGLTALVVAAERGWIDRDDAYQRFERTVRFLYERVDHERGFFYHFVDAETGRRLWNCEASSIDTALLLAGALTAAQTFPGTEAADLTQAIYERVNWPWMLDGQTTMSMGWTPEGGFIRWRWDHYSEHLVLQLLGLGSPTHPLPAETWHAWERGPVRQHNQQGFMTFPPLFIHQFSHAWVDFRNKRDDYANYFRNSELATLAHRDMFQVLAERFPHYGPMLWGVTASDSADGYLAWGGPDPSPEIDGTVVPCAAAGSIPFAPEACVPAVQHMFTAYGQNAWRRYGLVDAFNPKTGWYAPDVIGIDLGITLLMIENHRTGLVWSRFMQDPAIELAMDRANFRNLDPVSELADALFFEFTPEPQPETGTEPGEASQP